MNNWRTAGANMYQNSRATRTRSLPSRQHPHGGVPRDLRLESTGRFEGAAIQSAYRTFAFDSQSGRVQLADIVDPGDPSLGAPFIQAAWIRRRRPRPQHLPVHTGPVDTGQGLLGGYKAWALTPGRTDPACGLSGRQGLPDRASPGPLHLVDDRRCGAATFRWVPWRLPFAAGSRPR